MAEKKSNLLLYVLIFIGTFLILQSFQGGKEQVDNFLDTGDIGMKMAKSTFVTGRDIRAEVKNNTEEEIILESNCPHPPLEVLKYEDESFIPVTNGDKRNCDRVEDIILKPGKKQIISLQDYSYSLFGEPGRYKLELTTNLDGIETTFDTPEFEIREPNFITKGWRAVLYQPILNALVAILIYMPAHNLALSVIVLTIIIRTILLIPSQKGMRAQKKMQAIQPKLEEIKKKYAKDQARVAQETMALWKKHQVHPFSSCVPLLIQFPILIALFYVIRTGLAPDQAILIYSFLPEFSLADINPYIFKFNLFDRSIIVLPLIIGGLQFLQMQLMMHKRKKKGKDGKKQGGSEMEMANNMMKYVMPIMIAVFTSQLPAAVGLYWGTSTLYGIIQQLVINKEGKENPLKDDGVKVRVINKKS